MRAPRINPRSGSGSAGRRRALWLVSLAVFLASSTWFSGTAAAPALRRLWTLSDVQAAWLTISVQLGFIAGTFLYAVFNVADIFRPRRVFFLSAVAGALFNAGFALLASGFSVAVLFRFLTGLTLAGVYPVGMKIVAQWYRSGLGWGLSVMVGALTLGTALPYLILGIGGTSNYRLWLGGASALAVLGGFLAGFGVREGPYLKEAARFDARAAFRLFRHRPFRLHSLGYFGHMWELYAFWSLGGFYLAESLGVREPVRPEGISLLMFSVVGAGIAGCLIGGIISRRIGEKPVALAALALSAAFCLASGAIFILPLALLIPLCLVWGAAVVADSPQFSSLAVQTCPSEYTGTALTIQNGIGFAVTVVSIQFLAWLGQTVGWRWAFTVLAAGPIIGAAALLRLKNETPSDHPSRPTIAAGMSSG